MRRRPRVVDRLIAAMWHLAQTDPTKFRELCAGIPEPRRKVEKKSTK